MITTLSMALCLVLTFFVTMGRVFSIRRLLGYGMALDLSFTFTALAMFHGTLEGMLIATISGLIMALTITLARAAIGYDRAAGIYIQGFFPRILWLSTPPTAFARITRLAPILHISHFLQNGYATLKDLKSAASHARPHDKAR